MVHISTDTKHKKYIALIIALSVFFALLSMMTIYIYNYSEQLKADHEYKTSIIYHNLIDEVQDFKNRNISLLSGFSAYIQMQDSYSDEDIYTYLDYLLMNNLEDIRNVGIFQDTTLKWVYPLEGNESVIGIDFLNVPSQAEAVLKVKEELKSLFVGPVDLLQGGVGFIIRTPLFKDNEYWGMVSIVLKAENAFEFIDDYSENHQMEYLVTYSERPDKIIFGDKKVLDMSPLKFKTEDSFGGWDIYTAPSDGWKDYKNDFIAVIVIFILISMIIANKIYRWIINYNLILIDKMELEKKFILDRFTGIYTREYFNLRVHEEFSQALRRNYSISMIYFDLDHFKKVNDTYGHAKGDQVLLAVVDCVKKIVRNEDVFSRWGGDEFILLLPHTKLLEVENLSNRIRLCIEELEISKRFGVTVSIGCSQWIPREYLESWFSRTDNALYISKNTGKNKVTVNDHNTEKNILMKIGWDEALNSGHPVIDAEHQNLLNRCNAIIESSLSKSSFNDTLRNVDAFLYEIEQHFLNEIRILKKVNYPEVNEHIAIHDTLLERAKEIYEKTLHEDITPVELFAFLLDTILESHLRNDDVKYFKYLK